MLLNYFSAFNSHTLAPIYVLLSWLTRRHCDFKNRVGTWELSHYDLVWGTMFFLWGTICVNNLSLSQTWERFQISQFKFFFSTSCFLHSHNAPRVNFYCSFFKFISFCNQLSPCSSFFLFNFFLCYVFSVGSFLCIDYGVAIVCYYTWYYRCTVVCLYCSF